MAKNRTKLTNIDDLFHQFLLVCWKCLLKFSVMSGDELVCVMKQHTKRDMDLLSKLSMFSWPTWILVYRWKLVLQRFVATGMKKHEALQKCTNTAIRNWLSDRNWRKEFNLTFKHFSSGILIGSFIAFQSRFGQSQICGLYCKQTYWINPSGKIPRVEAEWL